MKMRKNRNTHRCKNTYAGGCKNQNKGMKSGERKAPQLRRCREDAYRLLKKVGTVCMYVHTHTHPAICSLICQKTKGSWWVLVVREKCPCRAVQVALPRGKLFLTVQ